MRKLWVEAFGPYDPAAHAQLKASAIIIAGMITVFVIVWIILFGWEASLWFLLFMVVLLGVTSAILIGFTLLSTYFRRGR